MSSCQIMLMLLYQDFTNAPLAYTLPFWSQVNRMYKWTNFRENHPPPPRRQRTLKGHGASGAACMGGIDTMHNTQMVCRHTEKQWDTKRDAICSCNELVYMRKSRTCARCAKGVLCKLWTGPLKKVKILFSTAHLLEMSFRMMYWP